MSTFTRKVDNVDEIFDFDSGDCIKIKDAQPGVYNIIAYQEKLGKFGVSYVLMSDKNIMLWSNKFINIYLERKSHNSSFKLTIDDNKRVRIDGYSTITKLV